MSPRPLRFGPLGAVGQRSAPLRPGEGLGHYRQMEVLMDSRCWRKLIPLLFFVPLACGDAPAEVPLEQEFTLAPGQTVEVAGSGLRITFQRVRDDNRCPSDVVCVWAGNATVELVLRRSPGDTTVAVNTLVDPRAVVSGALFIELVGLAPAPRSTEPTDPGQYRARLRVIELGT